MKPCTVNDNAQDDESPKQDIYARISAKIVACRSPESDRRTRLIHRLIAGQNSSRWPRSSSRFDPSR